MCTVALVVLVAVPTYADITAEPVDGGPVLIAGTVPAALVDSVAQVTGEAAAIRLELALWPSAEVLAERGEGAESRLWPAGEVTVGSGEAFQFRLRPEDVPDDYVGADGQIDVTLAVAGVANLPRWSFSADHRPVESSRGGSTTEWFVHGGEAPDNVAPQAAFDALTSAAAQAPATTATREDGTSESDDFSTAYCTTFTGNRHGPYEVRTIDVHSTSGRPGRGHFNSGTNSSVTAGIATKSSGGSWQATGTLTRSTSVGWTSGYSATPHRLYTNWYYRNYRMYCNGYYVGEEDRLDAYYSRGRTANLVAQSYSYCSGIHNGEWWRQSGVAGTYSYGVSLHGISLKSQSGFNSGVKLNLSFSSNSGRVCGSNSSGELAPWVRAKAP